MVRQEVAALSTQMQGQSQGQLQAQQQQLLTMSGQVQSLSREVSDIKQALAMMTDGMQVRNIFISLKLMVLAFQSS